MFRFVCSKGGGGNKDGEREDEVEGAGKGEREHRTMDNGRFVRLFSVPCYESLTGQLGPAPWTTATILPYLLYLLIGYDYLTLPDARMGADAGQSRGGWDLNYLAEFAHAVQSQRRIAVEKSKFGIRGLNMKQQSRWLP